VKIQSDWEMLDALEHLIFGFSSSCNIMLFALSVICSFYGIEFLFVISSYV
jgi:hypothetical protein